MVKVEAASKDDPSQGSPVTAQSEAADNVTWSVRGLTKRFGGTLALDSVSLSFPRGSVTGLLGENGAGKSTLLSILGGLTPPSAGAVLKNDDVVLFRTPRDSRAAGIAVVPQEPVVVAALSIAENIYLGRLPHKLSFERRRLVSKRADELVSALGLTSLQNTSRPARGISAADRQLIEILRAFVSKPALLALDEPTTALDTEQVDSLVRLVERLRVEGVAVVYVTHRLAELDRVASRVVVLRDGRLAATHEARLADLDVSKILGEMTGRAFEAVTRTKRHMRDDVAISAHGLSTKRIKSIDLDVHYGEILGIAGLAGSGRTQLAKALSGFSRLRSGELVLNGKSVDGGRRFNPERSGVVYISEDRHDEGLLLNRSVRENISISSLHRLQTASFVSRKREGLLADKLVNDLDIKCSTIEMQVSALSGGNQQKVVIARALALGARIWVFDDPTKGVDIGAKNAIYRLLEERIALGDAVVLVSSEIQELRILADRIVVMRSGEISATFDGGDATEDMIVRSMFHLVDA